MLWKPEKGSDSMKVVIINGSGGVGKDRFVSLCEFHAQSNECVNVSSAELIKRAAIMLGWDECGEQKTEDVRKFLSDLTRMADELFDTRFKYMKSEYDSVKQHRPCTSILFFHIREPEMIERVKSEFDAVTLLIERPGVKPIMSNPSDRNVRHYSYDYVIQNDGTLDDLDKKAKWFVEQITENNNVRTE